MQKIKVKVLRSELGTSIPLPEYATSGAAGMDLRACISEPIVLLPGETKFIPTGLSIYLEDPTLAALILPRSGLGAKCGIVLGNSVGLIDSDYQGEITVALWNRKDTEFTIGVGERIAQLLIIPVVQGTFEVVNEFAASKRGTGGFGHTGSN